MRIFGQFEMSMSNSWRAYFPNLRSYMTSMVSTFRV